jgi:hypothetical protein
MSKLQPIDLQGTRIKNQSLSAPRNRRVIISLLVALIVSAMVVWLGLLGWGIIEILQSFATFTRSVWSALF